MASTIVSSRTAPLDFSLRNQQGQHVLFTRLPEQDLVLELRNNSNAELHIPAVSSNDDPTEKDCHFQLLFRSGTLWEPEKIKLGGDGVQTWKLSRPSVKTTGDVAFYLSYKGKGSDPLKLPVRGDTQLTLAHIGVDGRGGSRGTRVELIYQNLKFTGVEAPPSGTLMHYLAVMDESPADEPADVPILIDWCGPNTFLNDGTPTTRTLRLFNNSGKPLQIQKAAKITIDVPVGTDATGFALIAENEKATVIVEGVKDKDDWKRANNAQWPIELIPKADNLKLEANQSLDIPIKLQTTLASGPSWIAVSYDGFEHLEGKRRVPVMKTSLIATENGCVAIGVATSNDKLSVNGGAWIKDGAGVGGFTIGQNGNKEYTASYETIGTASGTLNLRLQSHRSIMFHSGSANQPPVRMVIDESGNVTCENMLTVNGDVDAKKEIHWGNGSALQLDQGGSLELGGNHARAGAGTPYIDFHFKGKTEDHNVRIINQLDGELHLLANNVSCKDVLTVNGDVVAKKNVGCEKLTVNGDIDAKQEIYWGNRSTLLRDQGGSLKLGGNNAIAGIGTPYIDFHFKGKIEPNVKIINDADGELTITPKVKVPNLYATRLWFTTPSNESSWWRATANEGGGGWQYMTGVPGPGPSDIRLKADVRAIPSALDKVLQLQGSLFHWNETGFDYFTRDIPDQLSAGPAATPEESRQLWESERNKCRGTLAGEKVGLIAQELEAVLPQLVHEDERGYKHIHYDQVTALLVQAIKEQNVLIQKLSERIAALEDGKA